MLRPEDNEKITRVGPGTPGGEFMRRYWQRKPLLIRQAIPGVVAPLNRSELFALAGRDGVESRLIQRRGANWSLKPGPFMRGQIPALKAPGWTLLVQGVNLVHPAGDDLLRRFAFLPFARLDDLMVSYAAPGGATRCVGVINLTDRLGAKV